MSGTGAGGQTHPQPPIAPIVTLGPTTPKPDKSHIVLCSFLLSRWFHNLKDKSVSSPLQQSEMQQQLATFSTWDQLE
jgi:hypothetical protein